MSSHPAEGNPAPKPPQRKRVAPKHLLDGSNSEAPSAAHQAIVDATQAHLSAAAAIAKLIKNIEDLDAVLPATVAKGTEEDEIQCVLTTIHGLNEDSASSTFTHHFDILFKEDTQCGDANGRLHLIRRGDLGMLMVVRYLHKIKWNAPDMNLEGAMIKLERVVKEMETVCGMDRLGANTAAKAVPKPKTKAKSSKGTSANSGNAAKELMYDNLFTAVMRGRNNKGKPDNSYRPKEPNADLSEDEEDDFADGEDLGSASNNPKKRKLIVVDGIAQDPPLKKKKKPQKAPAAPRPTSMSSKLMLSQRTKDIMFKRKVGKNQLFGDEKPAPNLGNLATHYRSHHDDVPVPSDVQPGETRGVSASSAKIMADFLVDGKLNPAINSTQKNFFKVFSAWIIEDDLPFTTGETPGIQRLFAFLTPCYSLQSDTTVRDTLAEMQRSCTQPRRLARNVLGIDTPGGLDHLKAVLFGGRQRVYPVFAHLPVRFEFEWCN
ncbi:hypothetical protein B0H10DRAFT_2199225 [Mycena sp. CBHHK59/15]|nr:hypothetical protein B0H10DRAFT_2199225 [Mycena sp. CBHHK59/15]